MTSCSILEKLIGSYDAPFISRSDPLTPSEIVQRVVDNGEDIRIIGLGVVRRNLAAIREHFSFAEHYLAVKAVTQPNNFDALVNEHARSAGCGPRRSSEGSRSGKLTFVTPIAGVALAALWP